MNRRDEANRTICEINACINLLYSSPCDETRNNILNYLGCKVYDLYLINNLDGTLLPTAAMTANALPLSNSRQFTKEELSAFNGKNGNPAYVAVNGTVYDVTNNAAWGAATHFGLSAGNDLTAQFNSCHAGQPILEKLPIVGKMI
ncbi:cytochrome b5 domain-containing protein [Caproiciproducens galactitolivorans]|uniref:Cytochrome B5 n=1 Tax=Caproiciproducens galactitolivorans TaxID=642589 RepID=A0ABT4BSA1_9FIRM|nr:cytochrome b5 domain-containing protein [Caproiciproducens galactitolivorans]MCY1713776.1 cytochrome B5 [Caproiciproducens galactitolivorans]